MGRTRSVAEVPDELAAQLATGGEVDLGEWDEAELRAAGIDPHAGEAGRPETSTPLARLDAEGQRAALGAALQDLVGRGLARPAGRRRPLALSGGLALARDSAHAPVFTLRGVQDGPTEDFRKVELNAARLADGSGVGLVDLRFHLATGRGRLRLRTPQRSAADLVDALYRWDEAAVGRPGTLPGCLFRGFLMWRQGREVRTIELSLEHLGDDEAATLASRADWDARLQGSASFTRSALVDKLVSLMAVPVGGT